MKIGILGCAGRMGRQLLKDVYYTDGVELSGGLEQKESPSLGVDLGTLMGIDPIGIHSTDDLESLISLSDAIIDFTSPAATLHALEVSSRLGTAHIIGTTGLTAAQQVKLETFAKHNTTVFAANMSIGVNLLLGLVELTASKLDTEYDIDIVEMHHRYKVDSPSGTALALGHAAADGRGVSLNDVACKSRDGQIGPRPEGEIGFATLRGGDVVGEHTVIFAADGERIEITHKASDRKIFSRGAIRAAQWTAEQKNGLYDMKDVLGLTKEI